MIPTAVQCSRLMDKHRMLENIRAHSYKVAQVAEFIAHSIIGTGISLSLDKVIGGALLHDIGKTACLDSDHNHALFGAKICAQHGFTGIVDIVAQHVVLKNGLSETGCTEKEIVYYADKRVLHEEVVSLEARLQYILARYGNGDERLCAAISGNFNTCLVLEEKLFARLHFRPDEVERLINARAPLAPFLASLESAG